MTAGAFAIDAAYARARTSSTWLYGATRTTLRVMIPLDTQPAAHAAQIEALRRLGAEGRVRVAAEMSEAMRQIAIDGVRRRNPGVTEAEARRMVARGAASTAP